MTTRNRSNNSAAQAPEPARAGDTDVACEKPAAAEPDATPETNIVARLNDMGHWTRRHYYSIGDYWDVVDEAADHIEVLERRLRAAEDERDRLRAATKFVLENLRDRGGELHLRADLDAARKP